MSMPRSRHASARVDVLLALAVLLAISGVALAKKSDQNQPIHITADSFTGNQDTGRATFTGKVQMDQGTFHADGAVANGYADPNDTSQWQRVVLTGSPAHFQQTQDSGALVHGQAQTIDYEVAQDIVILTGNAVVVEQGRGEFHGEKLVYNTDSGEIQGSASPGGRVHATFLPRTKPVPASAKPAASSAPASVPASAKPAASGASPSAPASAKPAASSAPASAPASAATAPASAATAGTD